jgi:Zn-dependent protease
LNLPLAVGVDFSNPLLWAVFVGWVMSVVLHEFAHGLVAYWGGDYTIRERGGLTLNPIQYVDPVMSLALPAIIFLIGGVPLPGGVTYVRRDLLRGPRWDAAVSAAGPAMNLLLAVGCLLPFHPAVGWVDMTVSAGEAPGWVVFLGAMALLQPLAAMFNLLPVPPLDGFGVIRPTLKPDTANWLSEPGTSLMLFIGIMILAPVILDFFVEGLVRVWLAVGVDASSVLYVLQCYRVALYGHA